jgi:hypothetical protein
MKTNRSAVENPTWSNMIPAIEGPMTPPIPVVNEYTIATKLKFTALDSLERFSLKIN